MRKLSLLVAVYLLLGVLFAHVELRGSEAWVCPDDASPHGYTTGSERTSDACERARSGAEQAGTFVLLTFFWLPLLAGRAIAQR